MNRLKIFCLLFMSAMLVALCCVGCIPTCKPITHTHRHEHPKPTPSVTEIYPIVVDASPYCVGIPSIDGGEC